MPSHTVSVDTHGKMIGAKKLSELPPHARLGGNDNAFVGAGRLWNS